MQIIRFTLNGEAVELGVDPGATLLDVLREHFHLTGVKCGCRSGDCGACTVIMNGSTVNSCLVPMGKVEGAEVLTVEGLSKDGKPDVIQQAFMDQCSVQCGYCIPGMVMSAKALLDANPNPDRQDIRAAIAGNICRCTGYVKIEAAIEQAARELRKQGETS